MNQPSAKPCIPAIASLTLLFLWSTLAAGQIEPRNLSGTVTDHQHEPLNGAVVQVENTVTLGVLSYITDRDGKYSFKRLDGDTDYSLWVTFRSHKSKVRHLSKFDSTRAKVIDFVIDLH